MPFSRLIINEQAHPVNHFLPRADFFPHAPCIFSEKTNKSACYFRIIGLQHQQFHQLTTSQPLNTNKHQTVKRKLKQPSISTISIFRKNSEKISGYFDISPKAAPQKPQHAGFIHQNKMASLLLYPLQQETTAGNDKFKHPRSAK